MRANARVHTHPRLSRRRALVPVQAILSRRTDTRAHSARVEARALNSAGPGAFPIPRFAKRATSTRAHWRT
eukprot:3142057-Pleurochrysis_carterae.AAC.1